MRNRRIFKWFLWGLILAGLILIIFRSRSPFGKSNTSFSSGTNEITRIEFKQEEKKLSLEKEGEKWLLNGNTETRKSSISFIIRVLQELSIKSPVSPELFRSVIKEKGIEPVKVRVWEKRKLLNTFLVYKTQSNLYGNIMMKSERAKPFIVYVPGHDGDIGSAFTLNELYWQPYTIFNLLPSEIKRVDFWNSKDKSGSFSVARENRHLSVSDGNKELQGWDSVLVVRYLSYFTYIPFESWALDLNEAEMDSVTAQPPLYSIDVTHADGRKTELDLWERTAENGEKDSDRMYGKTGSNDEIFIVRFFDIDPLLKRRSYFFK